MLTVKTIEKNKAEKIEKIKYVLYGESLFAIKLPPLCFTDIVVNR
ncbi:hypothetical protein SDC9_183137 [bioreactor metagenome]|uniref:Uncharacterized protein n=1 Tax=bioreactor metagenome TaxID=1076179 RepID=A0A645HBY9_9ZZZZ